MPGPALAIPPTSIRRPRRSVNLEFPHEGHIWESFEDKAMTTTEQKTTQIASPGAIAGVDWERGAAGTRYWTGLEFGAIFTTSVDRVTAGNS